MKRCSAASCDRIVAHVDVPTIMGRIEDEPIERIIIAVPAAVTALAARGAFTLAAETARRLRMDAPAPVLTLSQQHSEQFAETTRDILEGTYEHRPQDLIDTLRQEIRPGDLIVLPVTRSRGRVPDLGARVADELPDIPLLIVMGGAASRLGELPHARLTAEFPFGPPPWTRESR